MVFAVGRNLIPLGIWMIPGQTGLAIVHRLERAPHVAPLRTMAWDCMGVLRLGLESFKFKTIH